MGTWAYRFHVERACKWDRNSSRGVTMIIPSRSSPTIQPIYRSLLFNLSHTIQEKFRIRIFHSRCFYGCGTHVLLSRCLQSNEALREFRIAIDRCSSYFGVKYGIKIDALTKLRSCNCSLVQRDIYTRKHIYMPRTIRVSAVYRRIILSLLLDGGTTSCSLFNAFGSRTTS